MASQFSKDGKYFAVLSLDGKLKLWNTLTGKLEQEFIPNGHLSCPCTCLHFVEGQISHNKDVSPTKKKRKSSSGSSQYVILGTNTGAVLGYSLSTANIVINLNSNTNKVVNCLSWDLGDKIYAGIEQNVYVFNLQELNIEKWKTETNNITGIKVIPDGKLLTASKKIKLWNIRTKEVLKTFTGHSSDVHIIEYIKTNHNYGDYFITGSKADRLLSCWSLNPQNNDTNASSTFLMDDVVDNLAIFHSTTGTTSFAALTRGGSVYFYQHTLNGRSKAPLKPQTVIQIASNSSDKEKTSIQIPLLGVIFEEDLVIKICYGLDVNSNLTFETVTIKRDEKVQCLVRNDKLLFKSKNKIVQDQNNVKIQQPLVGNYVHYLTQHSTPSSLAVKRKLNGANEEVPMEKRLENLMLTKSDSKVPKVANLSQLLIQGIHSKDKTILHTVLNKQDEKIIKSTVKRLPISAIVSLLQELSEFVNGKTLSCSISAIWIKQILEIHSGLLLSNPKLSELLTPILKNIEKRLTLQTSLNKLQGRLSLLMTQVSGHNRDENEEGNEDDDILNYVDKSSESDSEVECMDVSQKSSDNEWSEEESDPEGGKNNDGESLSDDEGESEDEEMSS